MHTTENILFHRHIWSFYMLSVKEFYLASSLHYTQSSVQERSKGASIKLITNLPRYHLTTDLPLYTKWPSSWNMKWLLSQVYQHTSRNWYIYHLRAKGQCLFLDNILDKNDKISDFYILFLYIRFSTCQTFNYNV